MSRKKLAHFPKKPEPNPPGSDEIDGMHFLEVVAIPNLMDVVDDPAQYRYLFNAVSALSLFENIRDHPWKTETPLASQLLTVLRDAIHRVECLPELNEDQEHELWELKDYLKDLSGAQV